MIDTLCILWILSFIIWFLTYISWMYYCMFYIVNNILYIWYYISRIVHLIGTHIIPPSDTSWILGLSPIWCTNGMASTCQCHSGQQWLSCWGRKPWRWHWRMAVPTASSKVPQGMFSFVRNEIFWGYFGEDSSHQHEITITFRFVCAAFWLGKSLHIPIGTFRNGCFTTSNNL